jgi:3-isopropylmalate/(R)-2-methylmalate dehydratase large subunit
MKPKMPHTITEKIISKHVGHSVSAGDFVVANVDLVMAHDSTCAWASEPFYEIADKVWNKNKIFIPLDHAYPCPNLQMAKMQHTVRSFAKDQGIPVVTDGVCHQLLAEKYVKPGDLILGADSHTPTSGALGALTIGVGSSDAAIAMATGKCWLQVPATIRLNIKGKLAKGVYAKDIILMIAKKLGPMEGLYKVFEFGGETVEQLSIADRLTLTNMSAEIGVKAAIVEPDDITRKYILANKRKCQRSFAKLKSDPKAKYYKVYNFDISKLVPQVACPHEVDNVKVVAEIEKKKTKIDQVFIGSCTNGRLEDLDIVYQVWQNRKLNPNVRVIITPASRQVYLEALKNGCLEFFTKLGAIITNPGCGACLGRHGGVLYDQEVCLATTNRNFMGRMGSAKSFIYLSSPATAAASAVTGYITDPRSFI